MWTALLLVALGFHAEVNKASRAYESAREQSKDALTTADLGAAQKCFLDAVAEKDRTAAHWFLLGNLWFDMDPAFAYRMHEKAFALAPDEPLVMREWALELHRAGKWSDASALYVKLEKGDGDEVQITRAMHADCLLALGKPAEAVECWNIARKGDPEHLEHAFDWVHGSEHPMRKRARLRAEINAGKLDGAEDLILGDVFWEREDDRYFVQYDYMESDRDLVFGKLGRESRRAKDLSAVMDYAFIDWEQQFPRYEDATPKKTLEKYAKDLHWIGDTPQLPEHARVARVVLEALLELKMRSADDLLSDFAKTLHERAKAGDAEAARTLVWLAEKGESSKLGEYRALVKPDERAMKRAAVEKARADKQPLADPLVQQALAEIAAPDRAMNEIDGAFKSLAEALASKPH